MNIFRLQANPPSPVPENYEEEIETLKRIIFLCDYIEEVPDFEDTETVGRVTPWVAFQLSLLAQVEVEAGRTERALIVGATSVEAADLAGSRDQLFRNLNDWGYVLVRAGKLSEAAATYSAIIDSPLPEADSAKPMAHISLGSIYKSGWEQGKQRELAREALYHYEKGLRFAGNSVEEDGRKVLLEQLVPLYRELNDAAGAAHCASQLGGKNVEEVLRKHVTGMSVELVVTLTTRLRSLEEHRLAEVAFETWMRTRAAPAA